MTLYSDNFNDNVLASGIWNIINYDTGDATTSGFEQNQRYEWHQHIDLDDNDEAYVEFYQDTISGSWDASVKFVDFITDNPDSTYFNFVLTSADTDTHHGGGIGWEYDLGSTMVWAFYHEGGTTISDLYYDIEPPFWFRVKYFLGKAYFYYATTSGVWNLILTCPNPTESDYRLVMMYPWLFSYYYGEKINSYAFIDDFVSTPPTLTEWSDGAIYYTSGTVQSGTGDGNAWVDAEYAYDSYIETEAAITLTSGTRSDNFLFTVNNNTTTSGNIGEVYIDGDYSGTDVFVQPVFSGTISGAIGPLPNYIMLDPAGPGFGNWTWDDINNLDVIVYAGETDSERSVYLNRITLTIDSEDYYQYWSDGAIYYTAGQVIEETGNGGIWYDANEAYDTISGSNAFVELGGNNVSDYFLFTANNNTTTSGIINQVVINYDSGYNGYWNYIYAYPVFNGTSLGTYGQLPLDITADEAGPGVGGWTWDDINNLDVKLFVVNYVYGGTTYIDRIRLEIDSTPPTYWSDGKIYCVSGTVQTGTGDGDLWSNPSLAYDNIEGSQAKVILGLTNRSDDFLFTANNNTTSTGTIGQVIIDYDGSTDWWNRVYAIPVFNGTTSGTAGQLPLDITIDTAGPGAYSWTWSDINNLDIVVYVSNITSGGTTYIDRITVETSPSEITNWDDGAIYYTSGVVQSGTGDGDLWINPTYAYDDIEGSKAKVLLGSDNTSDSFLFTVNNNSTASGSVGNVVINYDGTNGFWNELYAQPIFNGTTSGTVGQLPLDITEDAAGPGGYGWDWDDINNLDVRIYVVNDTFSSTTYIDRITIEIEPLDIDYWTDDTIYYTAGTVLSGSGDKTWVNSNYAYDTISGSQAYVSLSAGNTSDSFLFTANNNATASGSIGEVIINYDGSNAFWNSVYAQPIFNGTSSGTIGQLPLEITADTAGPGAFEWEWSDINNLDVRIYVNNIISGGTTYVDRITLETAPLVLTNWDATYVYYTAGTVDSGTGDGDVWHYPQYGYDSYVETEAYVELSSGNRSDDFLFTTNNNNESATTVYNVIIDWDGTKGNNNTVYATPVFDGTTPGTPGTLPLDITEDAAGPGRGNWTWADVDNLDVKVYSQNSGSNSTTYLNRIKLQIMDHLYGLECWDVNGVKTLSVFDSITKMIYSGVASSGVDGSTTVSNIYYDSGIESDELSEIFNCGYIAFPLEQGKIAHQVNVSVGYYSSSPPPNAWVNVDITWAARTIDDGVGGIAAQSSDTLIMVFIY